MEWIKRVRNWLLPRKLAVGAVVGVAALFFVRLWFAATVELLPEEAYYWTYSQHPALSYFDHPPMVAWVVAAGTLFFGHTEWGVRSGMVALSVGSVLLVWSLTRRWFGERAAWIAAVMFNLLPIYFVTGTLAFPDGPLVFFWLVTMWAVTRAIGVGEPVRLLHGASARRRTVNRWWLVAGVAFGCAMLSKYTAVFLGVSLGLFFALAPAYRRWLIRPQPWLAVAVAALVFGIVIIWNAQHDWASFAFQAGRTANQKHSILLDVPMFWIYQAIVLTPAGLALLVWALGRGLRRGLGRGDAAWHWVVAFSAPLFTVFAWASTKTEVHINWTAPAFLSVLMGMAALAEELGNQADTRRARRWRRALSLAGAVAVLALLASPAVMQGWITRAFAYRHAGGWHDLADQVEVAEHALQHETGLEPFILGADKYNLSAELSFYTREPEEQINVFALGQQGLGFGYWTNLEEWRGHPAIAVLPRLKASALTELHEHFRDVSEPEQLTVTRGGEIVRSVFVLRCYDYIPPDLAHLAAER